ncbi:hypothetical protein ECEC1865_6358, partial [Escherichia coli EC1865]
VICWNGKICTPSLPPLGAWMSTFLNAPPPRAPCNVSFRESMLSRFTCAAPM